MKYSRVIGTAMMFLVLGTTLPAFAQKGDEEKGKETAPQAEHQSQPQHAQPAAHPAQPQHAQAAPQQHTQKAEPQRAQATHEAQPRPAQSQPRAAQPQHAQASSSNLGGAQHGRISNANYTSHFGQGHSFHVGHPEFSGGYNRFQYGGYSFGYNQAWPVGWGYDDNCYVVYEDGGYYLYDLTHPGLHISLSIF